MLDVLITGGLLLDGAGNPAVRADVGITGDTITALGDLSSAESRLTLDLHPPAPPGIPIPHPHAPFFVCPGFIDAHSHSDTYLLIEPSAPSKLFQGITTEIIGNCGASAAPIRDMRGLPSDWSEQRYPAPWQTVAQYRRVLEQAGPAVNVVFLIGHNTLRRNVVGSENRPASAAEMGEMATLLEQGLAEGARGLSTGLIYPPGLYAPREEVATLAATAAGNGGRIYTTHMRSEGSRLLEAIDEALHIGRRSGLRVQISHLKTAGRRNWPLIDPALDRIRRARDEGLAVAADRYPYTSSSTELDSRLPGWALEGGRQAVLDRLRDPATRARIRAEMARTRSPEFWTTVTIGSTAHADNCRFRGMPLVRAAALLGLEPVDAFLHLIDTDELRTGAFFCGMSRENMKRILAEPYVMIGTDASLRAPQGPLSRDYPHPRAYGSFPRFLRMALDGETVPLPEAVRKITSLPAGQFGLEDRGVIAKGRKADLAVFDARTLRDTAEYAHPHQLARGLVYVIVNGVPTLRDGRLSGDRAGRWL